MRSALISTTTTHNYINGSSNPAPFIRRKTYELRCMVTSRYIPEALPIVEVLPPIKGSFRILHWALPEGLLVVAAVLERVEELAGGIVVHSRSGLLANPQGGKGRLGVGDFGLRAKQAEREVEREEAGKPQRVVRSYRPGERRDGNVVSLGVGS